MPRFHIKHNVVITEIDMCRYLRFLTCGLLSARATQTFDVSRLTGCFLFGTVDKGSNLRVNLLCAICTGENNIDSKARLRMFLVVRIRTAGRISATPVLENILTHVIVEL